MTNTTWIDDVFSYGVAVFFIFFGIVIPFILLNNAPRRRMAQLLGRMRENAPYEVFETLE